MIIYFIFILIVFSQIQSNLNYAFSKKLYFLFLRTKFEQNLKKITLKIDISNFFLLKKQNKNAKSITNLEKLIMKN